MSTLLYVVSWCIDNQETILAFIGVVFALLRATAWGRANKAALEAVSQVIEESGVKELKKKVAEEQQKLDPAASDALQAAVSTVDPGKETPKLANLLVKELLRTKFTGKPSKEVAS